jgi:hypothetical protein
MRMTGSAATALARTVVRALARRMKINACIGRRNPASADVTVENRPMKVDRFDHQQKKNQTTRADRDAGARTTAN